MKKLMAIIAGGAMVAGIIYLNETFRGTPELSWGLIPKAPLEVETEVPERRTIIHTITAPGTIEPVVEVDVSSRIVGRIVRLPLRDGAWVKAGDLLAELESGAYKARVRSAEARVKRLEASIRRAHANLEKAQRDAERARGLARRRAASSDEVADALTVLEGMTAVSQMAHQELIEAQASLSMAQEDLSYTMIRSPIDGLVSQMLVEEGEVVIPGTMNNAGTVMMVVSDMKRMQVRARIDEADVPLVHPDQRVWIYLTADAQRPLPGVVERVTPKGFQQGESATFETRILIKEQVERTRSGMTANVEIEVRQHDNVLTIPVQAVRHRRRRDLPDALKKSSESRTPSSAPTSNRAPSSERGPDRGRDTEADYVKAVFVVKDGVARMRLVETEISDETHVEIRTGLDPTDAVIVGPYRVLDILEEGRAVKEIKDGEGGGAS